MMLYGALVAAAVAALAAAAAYAVLAARPRLAYWPSVSEAGAAPGCYPVYASGMLVGSLLLAAGALAFVRHTVAAILAYGNRPNYAQCAAVVVLAAAAAYYNAKQGVVRIDVRAPDCPHQKAAGRFFMAVLALMPLISDLYNQVYKPSAWRRALRWTTFLVIVFDLLLQQAVLDAVQTNLSVSREIYELQNEMTSYFSFFQYALIGSFFLTLVSIIR